ncbi:MAG: hypothetical protein LBU12_06425 [Deltaproteobacteria bacterium]|nr:hypothetical protein [Deltaproteobacteria bacterium]
MSKFADENNLSITVCQVALSRRKWNKIEHILFPTLH